MQHSNTVKGQEDHCHCADHRDLLLHSFHHLLADFQSWNFICIVCLFIVFLLLVHVYIDCCGRCPVSMYVRHNLFKP